MNYIFTGINDSLIGGKHKTYLVSKFKDARDINVNFPIKLIDKKIYKYLKKEQADE